MPENADLLLAREAEEAAAVVPGVHIGALGLGDDGDGAEIGEAVKRYRFGEGEEDVSGFEDLEREERLLGEAGEVALEGVGLLLEGLGVVVGGRGAGAGGIRSVDFEGSVGAAEEELRAVG